jgi:8-oxo-dGTP pyrophosphatase MutT (NUDIX family)
MNQTLKALLPHLGDATNFTFEKRAAVCIVLRPSKQGELFDILYMQRADVPGDHWAGQIGFPGGKKDEEDESLLHTALREFHEEMGVDLNTKAKYLGPIDAVQGRRAGTELKFSIHPFVFFTEKELRFKLDADEVADYFWIPLERLLDPGMFEPYSLSYKSKEVQLPGVSFPNDKILWGLTYMMSLDFLQRMGKTEEVIQLHKKIAGADTDYISHLFPYP